MVEIWSRFRPFLNTNPPATLWCTWWGYLFGHFDLLAPGKSSIQVVNSFFKIMRQSPSLFLTQYKEEIYKSTLPRAEEKVASNCGLGGVCTLWGCRCQFYFLFGSPSSIIRCQADCHRATQSHAKVRVAWPSAPSLLHHNRVPVILRGNWNPRSHLCCHKLNRF